MPLLLLLSVGSSSIGQEFKGGRGDRLEVGKEIGCGSGRGEELVWLLVGIDRDTFLVVGREAGVGPVVQRLQLGWRTGLPLILATAATAGGGLPAQVSTVVAMAALGFEVYIVCQYKCQCGQ